MNKWCTFILTCFLVLFAYPASDLCAKIPTAKGEGLEIVLRGAKQRISFSRIVRVERWGIVVADGGLERTALYQVIKTAVLYDSIYVNAIKRYVLNLKVTVEKDSFVLDFSEAILPELKYTHPKKVIHYEYYTLNLCLDRVEQLQIGVAYSLWPLRKLVHHIAVSSGYPYSKDPSYYVYAMNYRIGQRVIAAKDTELALWMNWAVKFMEVGSDTASVHSTKNTFALGIGGIVNKDKDVFYSVDIGYYFSNVEIRRTTQRLRLLLGINRKF